MIKAKHRPNEHGCTCGTEPFRDSMVHALTCPINTRHYPTDYFEKGFSRYGDNVTAPRYEEQFKSEVTHEMMMCDCGHWFPRWVYYRCPSCQERHE